MRNLLCKDKNKNKIEKTTEKIATKASRRWWYYSSWLGNTVAAKGHTWKVQTTWDAGTTGYTIFEKWCKDFAEKSNGELKIKIDVLTYDLGNIMEKIKIISYQTFDCFAPIAML